MFKDKVIVITGASKGIGLEIGRALAREGAHLALIARNESDLRRASSLMEQEGPKSHIEIFPCDVSRSDQVMAAIERVFSQFGRIDGLVSVAGYAYPQYFDQTPIAEFEKQIQTNYLGAVYLIKACRPYLKPGSFIALTSSVLGYMGCFGYSSYSPSKFAIIGLAESLRQELAFENISVSVLCPPDTLTPGFEEENKTKPREISILSKTVRAMKPEDVARVFLKKIIKREFIVNCNLDSWIIYRLKSCAPEIFHKIFMSKLKKAKGIAKELV